MPLPIFLIANARSGTHLLRGFLEGSGQVENLDEVFNPVAMKDRPHGYFRFLAQRVAAEPDLAIPYADGRDRLFDDYLAYLAGLTSRPYLLIDCKYNGMHHFNGIWHDVDGPPRLVSLIRDHGYPVIHLVRRNTLEVYCSNLLAHASGRWHRPRGPDTPSVPDRTIRVNTDSLVDDLERLQTRVNFFAWALRDHAPMIQLFYEELLQDGSINPRLDSAIAELVGEPLDLPKTPAYAKVSPPLRDYVENYAEVIRALSGTRFLSMIS